MQPKVTLALVFDTKKTNNPDLGILKIRVTYRRIYRIYSTGIKVSSELWLRLKKVGPLLDNRVKDEDFIKLHRSIYGYTKRDGQCVEGSMDMYQNVIDDLGPNFTFPKLKVRIHKYGRVDSAEKGQLDVLKALENKAAELHSKDRIGSGDNYKTTAGSLRRFVQSLTTKERFDLGLEEGRKGKEASLSFSEITIRFLEHYEQWMARAGKSSKKPGGKPTPASSTTTGIYLRSLRCIFNDAIANKTILADLYPFGRRKYIIPQGNKPKKALPKASIENIKTYQPESDFEQRAHDLFLFTFYSNGMNMTDICRLRWKDIDEPTNTFTFMRKKTLRTTKGDAKLIKVYLRAETLAIIERWGNPDKKGYVFPFLEDGMNAQRQKAVISQIIQQTNKWMGRIGIKLGIPDKLVTYVARHSYGTTLLRAGVPIKYISDSYGHGSISTTENYFGLFEETEVKGFLKAL